MGKVYQLAFLAIIAAIAIAEPLKKEVFNLPPLIHFSDVFNTHSDKEHEKLTELTTPVVKPGKPGHPGGGSGYPGIGYPGASFPGNPGSGHQGSGFPGSGFPGSGHQGSGFPGSFYPGHQGSGFPGSFYPGHQGSGFPGSGFPGHQIGIPGNFPGGIIPGKPHNPQCYNYYGFPEKYFQPQATYAGYPSYSDQSTYSRSQDVELVERYCKFNDDGSKEYKLVLSNGLSIYQKVLVKNDDKDNIQLLEGYYSDKRDDNTYLTTYFRADENGYNAKFEISNAPPSYPNVSAMKPLPLPSQNPISKEMKK